ARWPLPVAAFPFMSLIPSVTFTRLRAGYGAAVFLLFATSAFSQEQAKPLARSVSPDGKWEFRAGAAGEQAILLSQKPAASRLPSCSLKKSTRMDLQKRWVERP